MSFPSKSEREMCWSARDRYWQCLESNDENQELCVKFKKEFDSKCPDQWVKYFIKKRKYEKFKETMNKNDWTFPTETKSDKSAS